MTSRPWRWSAAVFVMAFALNFAWEMAQSYLYEPMGTVWEASRRCLIASVGDGFMVLVVSAIVSRPWRNAGALFPALRAREYAAAAVLGLAVAVAVEWWGLGQGRWAYLPEMPRIPGTSLGLVPLAQMAVLTPLTMWLVSRGRRSKEHIPG